MNDNYSDSLNEKKTKYKQGAQLRVNWTTVVPKAARGFERSNWLLLPPIRLILTANKG
ncbi:hypothetical protein HMPREF9104_01343 [Lentilactobacillus kisonensis F0435]|uniref:Uncharacterized protein n=1 Tax=Lentilactobacillus kisonensis F0435 TaxID=797516 RepID=H1LFG7_9LACO|nr:hypothetical protein HMPREF9104_01343 [Lentilactobacillus kisonensis F0435]